LTVVLERARQPRRPRRRPIVCDQVAVKVNDDDNDYDYVNARSSRHGANLDYPGRSHTFDGDGRARP